MRALPAALVFALAGGALARGQGQGEAAADAALPGEVRREWEARDWALFPSSHVGEIGAALGSADWRERHRVCDALARSHAGAGFAARLPRTLLEGLLADPHPNVRARALELASGLDGGELDARVEELAADPSLAVRVALCRWLGRAAVGEPSPAWRAGVLLELARSGAGHLAETARQELATFGPGAPDARAALALYELERGGEEALVDLVAALLRTSIEAELVTALRAALVAYGDGVHALVEALALRAEQCGGHRVACDRERLVRGWNAGAPDAGWAARAARRELLIELARAGDAELGARLLVAATAGADPDPAFLVECAAWALEPDDAATRGLELPEELALELWGTLAARARALTPVAVAPWLVPGQSDGARRAAADAVAVRFAETAERAAEALLVPLLEDEDSVLREAAFRWLADGARVASRLARLHVAWSRLPAAERLDALRHLPRDVTPTPFLPELLDLAASEPPPIAAIELLGTFRGEPAVEQVLRAAFERELEALEARPAPQDYRAHELSARELASALRSSLRVDAVPLLDEALERSLHLAPGGAEAATYRPLLPKHLAALLEKTVQGRGELARRLAPDVPRRVRVEAGIALAGRTVPGAERAVPVLLADYAGCDTTLRQRILAALGRADDNDSEAFLSDVARSAAAPLEQRIAAVDALAAREADDELVLVAFDTLDTETRLAAIEALGASGSDAAIRALTTLRAGAHFASEPSIPPEDTARVRLAVDVALVELDALVGDWRADVFRRPSASAAQDLAARFRGESLARAESRWEGELRLARALTRARDLEGVLSLSGRWWRADSEFLAGVARTAAEVPSELDHAALLAEAALVALLGEPPDERRLERELGLLILLVDLASARREWRALAFWSERAFHLARTAPGGRRALERDMGAFERAAGRDPLARISSARWQARAWAAEGGRRAELAARAAPLVGCSRAAREAQERLEASLDR